MSIYILSEYVQECKTLRIEPSVEGLYSFKKQWKN